MIQSTNTKHTPKYVSTIAVFGMFLGLSIFFIAMHNVDMAWNLKNIQITTGKIWHETDIITGNPIQADVLYRENLANIYVGLAITFASAIAHGEFTHENS